MSQTVRSGASAASFLRSLPVSGPKEMRLSRKQAGVQKSPFRMDSNVISPAMSESRNKQLWPHGASPRNAEKNVVSAGWVPPSTDPGRKQANERPGN